MRGAPCGVRPRFAPPPALRRPVAPPLPAAPAPAPLPLVVALTPGHQRHRRRETSTSSRAGSAAWVNMALLVACQMLVASVSKPIGPSRSVAGNSFMAVRKTSAPPVSRPARTQRHRHSQHDLPGAVAQAARGLLQARIDLEQRWRAWSRRPAAGSARHRRSRAWRASDRARARSWRRRRPAPAR